MFDLSIPDSLSSKILGFASNLSDKNLLRIVDTVAKLTSIEWHDKGIDAMRTFIADKHPAIAGVKRALGKVNPKVRGKLFNNYVLRGVLLGYKKRLAFYNEYNVAPPGNLMISPTTSCNLRCYGCYAGTHIRTDELTQAEVEMMIEEAGKAGTNLVTWLGGESFIRPWIFDVLEKFPHVGFQIFTNGLLLDDDKIARLAELGNAMIAIGIDGPEEFTDGRKGQGAYRGALEVMRKLSDAGVLVGYSTMVSRQNFEAIYSDEFIGAMIDHGASFAWCAIAIPQGKACKDLQIMPTDEQKAMIPEKVRQARRNNEIVFIDFYADAKITEGCGAGRVSIHVNNVGDVEPCVFFPFAVDNIRQKPFLDILKSEFFQDIRKIHKKYPGELNTCMMATKPQEVLRVVQANNARETSEGTLEQVTALAEKRAS